MRKQILPELMNSWEWLNEFCASQRDNRELECGVHAVTIVKIDNYLSVWNELGQQKTAMMLENLKDILKTFAGDDTIVVQYSEDTFAIVLHYLENRDGIGKVGEEIRQTIESVGLGAPMPVTVSVGGAICHHDPHDGFKCAMVLAMDALAEARKQGNKVVISSAL